jgi:hypothetical protein
MRSRSSYEVAVEAGKGLSEGPYELETFEVAVEKDYVVVTA